LILVDANLLLYAYDPSSERHEAARRWLESVLSGFEPVGFAWATILAFLRIGTSHRAFTSPLTPEEAVAIVSGWLERPMVGVPSPGEHHWKILSDLLTTAQAHGPLVMDAHLAALAIEHGATLCTTDRDFTRFPGLRVVNPLHSDC
jgi:toxin-antitoxin system PIN domain toxin